MSLHHVRIMHLYCIWGLNCLDLVGCRLQAGAAGGGAPRGAGEQEARPAEVSGTIRSQ